MAKLITATRKGATLTGYLCIRTVRKEKLLRPSPPNADGTLNNTTYPDSEWVVVFNLYADKDERDTLCECLAAGSLVLPGTVQDPEAEAYRQLDKLTLNQGWAFKVTGDA